MKNNKQSLRRVRILSLFSIVCLGFANIALADSLGRAGVSSGENTCASSGCHAPTGGVLPTLTIDGPATLVAGATGSYTATITGGPGTTAGINIAATDPMGAAGVFAIVDTTYTQLATTPASAVGEIIHITPKPMTTGSTSYEFRWTAPTMAVTATLYAAALSSNGDLLVSGDDMALGTLAVTVTPAPNVAPIAVITAPAANFAGVVGVDVSFDATGSSDPDGAASTLQYSWDFGDSTSVVSGITATHPYTTPGTYTATLTVTDSAGATNAATRSITIAAAGTPVAPTANAGGPYNAVVNTPIALNGSLSTDPDGSIVSYGWDLGNGSTATGATPSVTYATPGTYTLTLTVTDDAGLTGTSTATAIISAEPTNVPPTPGQTLFEGKCASCHGPAAIGGTGPAIIGDSGHDIQEALEEFPAEHTSVATLTRSEIRAIGEYLKALNTANGGALFASNCESCHGADGVGTDAAPSIMDVSAEDMLEALADYEVEHTTVAALSEAEIEAIADFLAMKDDDDEDDEGTNDALAGNSEAQNSAAQKATSTPTPETSAGALDWLTLLIPGLWYAGRNKRK